MVAIQHEARRPLSLSIPKGAPEIESRSLNAHPFEGPMSRERERDATVPSPLLHLTESVVAVAPIPPSSEVE